MTNKAGGSSFLPKPLPPLRLRRNLGLQNFHREVLAKQLVLDLVHPTKSTFSQLVKHLVTIVDHVSRIRQKLQSAVVAGFCRFVPNLASRRHVALKFGVFRNFTERQPGWRSPAEIAFPSPPQQLTKRPKGIDVLRHRLEYSHDRHSQEQTNRPPEPPPEDTSQQHRKTIQLQVLT